MAPTPIGGVVRVTAPEIFKLAFETIIVGLLGFLWIIMVAFLVSPDDLSQFFIERIPAHAKDYQSFIGLAALTLAYCFGSAILPISRQLVNDEHLPINENAIRCEVLSNVRGIQAMVSSAENVTKKMGLAVESSKGEARSSSSRIMRN